MTKEETKQYFIELYLKYIGKEDIPEWANWIATDGDGDICVYQAKDIIKGYGNHWDFVCQARYKTMVNINAQPLWSESLVSIEELLKYYLSQQQEEPVQDKVEFEAVSGDQSLFDLVGACDEDKVIVKSLHSKAVFAMAEPLAEYTVLAERKVKEKPYIPEVGHTYKISYSGCVYSEVYVCLFVDQFSVLWSSHAGRMWQHYLTDYKFIRVN